MQKVICYTYQMNGILQMIVGILVTVVGVVTFLVPGGLDILSGLCLFFGGILLGMGYVFRALSDL